jgi:exopolysaccharide biosynthesis polyprenyl glycosylphosphotransferase
MVAASDVTCAVLVGAVAAEVRYLSQGYLAPTYLIITAALPILWVSTLALLGGYDSRFIGVGSDEFRRVLKSAVILAASMAIVSYALKLDVARSYLALAVPCITGFDLLGRYGLRKRLHRQRYSEGRYMRRVVVAGHAGAVADLVSFFRREAHDGMLVVAACVAGSALDSYIAEVPVCGGLGDVSAAVEKFDADTVAVVSCPEMCGVALRELSWQLEKSGTDLCVAPALLDVAGPRTTIRPVAGLPLLHVDHPDLAGVRQLLKGFFDRLAGGLAVLLLAPLFAVIALAILADDGRPVFFRQIRVGKDGRLFTVYKFRSMVIDAEQRRTRLTARNEAAGVLFKIRGDPRVTRVGGFLRRWSLDELPQLGNVVAGDMSLVGPRPALPDEAARYSDMMRRRLVVKPGITGLWQVSGRSDLPWEDAVRLDLRYVENWSFALDLIILWKTGSAIIRGSGAY